MAETVGRDIWRIWPMLKAYKWRMFTGIAMNMGARAFDLLPMVIIGLVVDQVTSGAELSGMTFVKYGAWVLLTFVGLAVFQTISDYAWDSLAQKVRHDLRIRLYEHYQSQEMAYFEEKQTGDAMSVLVNDVDQLENFLADSTTSVIRLVVTFVGVFGFLLYLDWRLAALLFAPLPLAVFAVRFFATRVQPQYRQSRQAVGQMNSILEANLHGMPVIQAYTAQDDQLARIEEQSRAYRDASVRAAKIRARFVPMLYAIAGLAYASLIGVGGYLTWAGLGPTTGDFVVFVLFATRLIMPLFILGMLLNQIQRSEAAAARVYEILDRAPAIVDRDDAVDAQAPVNELEVQNVVFGYQADKPILHNFNAKVGRGEMLAIVGPTGAGKSTLLKLLLRAYQPQHGEILVDGTPLDNLKIDSLRQQMGYVSQDAFLFSGTIRDNIKLGRKDASDAQVLEAARVAGAAEFIEKLDEGLDALVGERGIKLSGGQKQRISLARAILRDPAILILDEATSAMDSRTEELIQENLREHREGRITIAVAHRLSTIRGANEILVVVDGCITERGTHEELVAREGVYADLWRVQIGSS